MSDDLKEQNSELQTENETASLLTEVRKKTLWISIGALILTALFSVGLVLFSPEAQVIGKAFTTVLLLAGFSGIIVLLTKVSEKQNPYVALVSMVSWILILLIGVVKIWWDLVPVDEYYYYLNSAGEFGQFVLIVGVIQLAVLHFSLYTRLFFGVKSKFHQITGKVTVLIVFAIAAMIVIPLTLTQYDYSDFYWRGVVALSILGAVGTTLLPLVNALTRTDSKKTVIDGLPPAITPVAVPQVQEFIPVPQGWPVFSDGKTPLPILFDGSPDYQAFYSGQVSPQAKPTVFTQNTVAPQSEPTAPQN